MNNPDFFITSRSTYMVWNFLLKHILSRRVKGQTFYFKGEGITTVRELTQNFT